MQHRRVVALMNEHALAGWLAANMISGIARSFINSFRCRWSIPRTSGGQCYLFLKSKWAGGKFEENVLHWKIHIPSHAPTQIIFAELVIRRFSWLNKWWGIMETNKYIRPTRLQTSSIRICPKLWWLHQRHGSVWWTRGIFVIPLVFDSIYLPVKLSPPSPLFNNKIHLFHISWPQSLLF